MLVINHFCLPGIETAPRVLGILANPEEIQGELGAVGLEWSCSFGVRDILNHTMSYGSQDVGVTRVKRLQTSKAFCTPSSTPVQSNVS